MLLYLAAVDLEGHRCLDVRRQMSYGFEYYSRISHAARDFATVSMWVRNYYRDDTASSSALLMPGRRRLLSEKLRTMVGTKIPELLEREFIPTQREHISLYVQPTLCVYRVE